jgi:hypothetical protein
MTCNAVRGDGSCHWRTESTMSTLVPESSGNGTLVGVIGKSTLCHEDGMSRIFLRVATLESRPQPEESSFGTARAEPGHHAGRNLPRCYRGRRKGERACVRGFGRVVSSRR